MASDVPSMDSDGSHEHVALLAGVDASGRPVHEQVPAARMHDDVYKMIGTPALVDGCAAGDLIRVTPDGTFTVLTREGNVAIQAFAPAAFTTTEVERLTDAFNALGGLVEAPHDRQFLVVTVPIRAGFAAIEAAMAAWHAATPHAEWAFGNVYADDGSPLNWWLDA